MAKQSGDRSLDNNLDNATTKAAIPGGLYMP
jgi:hypothetical protein